MRRAGGDGEGILKVDMRNAAGFVRHKDAHVTNFLLPIKSLSLKHHNHVPRLEESRVLQSCIM